MLNESVCVGCRVCEKVCPKQAISIQPKYLGFLYPYIDESSCIKCGLCEKTCPTNNIKSAHIVKTFVAKNTDTQERMQSASGGVFYLLAKYILSIHGVIYGAVFDTDFSVYIGRTETDVSPMLSSKYVAADVRDSYETCKEDLDAGRVVLYSGTPCQIYGLKSFLKKDYPNLFTADIFCHGVPSPKIWQNYLNSFNREVASVNFRDKHNGWENYHITIKFKNGAVFSENYKQNRYMQLFLNNSILRKSCFSCKFRESQISDISLGDAWGLTTPFNDHKGVNSVVIHSKAGLDLFEKISCASQSIPASFCIKGFSQHWNIPAIRSLFIKHLVSPKYAMITIPGHNNVGNTLQAFALQSKVLEIQPNATIEIINQPKSWKMLSFYKDKVHYTFNGFNNTYTGIIVGSDQIWNNAFMRSVSLEEKYLGVDVPSKVAYAPSFGNHVNTYSPEDIMKISRMLKSVRYVSTREYSGVFLLDKWFGKKGIPVLDPTMLYDSEFYLQAIHTDPCKRKRGVFVYVLDRNSLWEKKIKEVADFLGEPVLPYDGSVESFLGNMNNARCVITDSYHGSVFSILFDNPFVTLRNEKRGNDRFDDLSGRFGIGNRFVYSLNDMPLDLLRQNPGVLPIVHSQRKVSVKFLETALKASL